MLRPGGAAIAALTLALAAPRIASAAPLSDEQVAQSLFETGRALMDRGEFAKACPMLAESQRLDPGGGTLLNVALCHEGEGKLATAYLEFSQAVTQAVKDGRKDREDIARQHLATLSPKLPRILIRVASPRPEGLTIQIDGAPASAAMLDVATPVDPGKHVVDVGAPGFQTSHWEGESLPSTTADVTIALRPVTAGAPSSEDKPRAPGDKSGGPSTRSILFWSAGGLAVGSLVFYALSVSARGSALEKCLPDRNFCTDEDGVSAVSRARTFAWVSIGMLGAAAVAGSVGLFMSDDRGSRTALTARPLVGGGAVSFERRF